MTKKQKPARRKPWVDPDDAPEWTDDMIARAEIREGHRIIRPDQPTLDVPPVSPARKSPKA
jgi:hypothetical protein